MAMLDLLRSRWRHSDPEVRGRAAERITDPRVLSTLACSDPSYSVRSAATARLADQSLLARIAGGDPEPSVRRAAIRQLTDQAALTEIARTDREMENRLLAAERLQNAAAAQALYAEMARCSDDDRPVERIKDAELLAQVAATAVSPRARLHAAHQAAARVFRARLGIRDPEAQPRAPEAVVAVLLTLAADRTLPNEMRLQALKDAAGLGGPYDELAAIIPTIDDADVRLQAACHFIFEKTESPEGATSSLVHLARVWVPVHPAEYVQSRFGGFASSWGAPKLVTLDGLDAVARIVRPNLEWSAKEPGFHHFTLAARPNMGLAQVMTWCDGRGASFCVWRSADGFHLCGNKDADY